jgi:hypothetical protein
MISLNGRPLLCIVVMSSQKFCWYFCWYLGRDDDEGGS